jgi:hypothetical protein
MLRSRIYHNTWYRNHDYGLQLVDLGQKPDPHQIQGNVLLNNLRHWGQSFFCISSGLLNFFLRQYSCALGKR